MRSRNVAGLLAVLAACSYAEPPDVLPPLFAAIHPSFANAGDTIMLEGTFSRTTTVEFPGGATQRATVHGPHRASVVVPDGVEDGGLFVTSGNVRLGPVAFRRPPASPSLQVFLPGPGLKIDRIAPSAVVVGDYLYVVGGLSSGGPLDTIERAEIRPDGTLGEFNVTSQKLTAIRHRHAAVTAGDHYYLLGGSRDDALSVESARMSTDGSLRMAEAAGTLVQNRTGPAGEMIGNRLYVLGGDSVNVEYAQLDGMPLDFVVVPGLSVRPDDPGATARIAALSTVLDDSICLLGGSKEPGQVNSIACASISPDGSLGEFTPGGSFDAYSGSAGVVVGRYLYVLGGNDGGGATDRVLRIPLDGIDSFEPITEAPLGVARFDATAVVVRSSICVIGGQGGPVPGTSVECAAFAMAGATARPAADE